MRRPYRVTATRPVPGVQLVPERPLTSRSIRAPQHAFRVRIKPWQLVPCAFAAVIPGDTIKAASMKMRVLSQPLKDKLSGWWLETFLFYVRLGDLPDNVQDDFKAMILAGSALTKNSGMAEFYTPAATPSWVNACYDACTWTYFRNEDSDVDINSGFGNYYVAGVAGPGGAFDSLATADSMDDGAPDDADEWVKKWEAWQAMRQEKVTTATWEEFLGAQGIALPPQLVQTEANRKPELLHFTRDWQFPVQAIEPSTGTPSALVQWSLADRLKRGRFCAEPGFLLQLVCARPKALFKRQRGNMTEYLMDDRSAWSDVQMEQDPHNRLRMFEGVGTVGGAGDGPVYGAVKDYWMDPNDLLGRGDQFTNFDLGSTVAGALDGMTLVDLPKEQTNFGVTAVNTRYPSQTDSEAVFSGSNKWIDVDGVTTFRIASRAARGDATGKRGGMT